MEYFYLYILLYSYVISSDYSETITTRHFAFDSYEQALSEGIYKSLKLIK